ncbi:choline dehydrogenase-like flavoprotein [Kribbella sp. VKM Ac-2527]|uniref:Choline dehydrogenase-like flavoprotein n=1 Tax=Kribbella caucasensis TaxID=2512215 RepID=A0A4R6KPV9_9ACTN|nr:GMC family oxidoreductase [Kribbella sp. VKM Ac-2527]TDO51639.1 choline dehydrogenase-like flavoprotein [Kribbella sp. VKM Ac-2527]
MIADWTVVTAFCDRLIPADEHPSAAAAGLVDDLARDAAGFQRQLWADLLQPGFEALSAEVAVRDLKGFFELDATHQDALIKDLIEGRTRAEWPVGSALFVSTMIRLVVEKYYGARNAPGWPMVGYNPAPRRSSGLAGTPPMGLPVRRLCDANDHYDVIVVGCGAGGGVAASVLTAAGMKVLVLDRGEYLTYEQVGTDHLRNYRLSTYGHNTPPGILDAGHRLSVDSSGRETLVPPWAFEYGALPHTVGGGTRLYQGMAWRLTPADFELASTHGVPDGSSLADWPFDYAELEPYYDRAEQEIGVCGDGRAHANQGLRSREYPMPPLPDNSEARLLRAGADKLGLSTGPVPMLINSEPRAGRGRCAQCGECVGFACPTDAKNGPYNTVLPKAVAAGCDLVTGARAVEVRTGSSGRVSGVLVVDVRTDERRVISAGNVVLAASAIETARLLLNSRSAHHPDGLGNHSDQVGRHLQGHIYVSGFGLFDAPVIDGPGPNVRIATCDYVNALPGVIGGGVLANEAVKLPILHWHWALPPDAPRWGLAGKHAMRDLYRRTSHVFGPIQETPTPDARVTLDRRIVDRYGIPVARLSGQHHHESIRAARAQQDKALEWLEASGATRVWPSQTPISTQVVGGQHQAGTCRMGEDPGTSVTDPWGRVHGHDNLWVMDASLHVTNGGFNPVLTVLALAYRSAERLVAESGRRA